jgi:hypothetical protein
MLIEPRKLHVGFAVGRTASKNLPQPGLAFFDVAIGHSTRSKSKKRLPVQRIAAMKFFKDFADLAAFATPPFQQFVQLKESLAILRESLCHFP